MLPWVVAGKERRHGSIGARFGAPRLPSRAHRNRDLQRRHEHPDADRSTFHAPGLQPGHPGTERGHSSRPRRDHHRPLPVARLLRSYAPAHPGAGRALRGRGHPPEGVQGGGDAAAPQRPPWRWPAAAPRPRPDPQLHFERRPGGVRRPAIPAFPDPDLLPDRSHHRLGGCGRRGDHLPPHRGNRTVGALAHPEDFRASQPEARCDRGRTAQRGSIARPRHGGPAFGALGHHQSRV